jgi:predicted O-methyltransferase YrrM
MPGKREFTVDWLPASLSDQWRRHVLPRLSHPLRWLELGSHEGRSACWVIDHVLEADDALVCVDIWRDARVEARFDTNTAGRVEKVKGRTGEFLVRAAAAGDRYNVVYVDADHEAKSVLEDIVLSWHLLPVGGFVILDDYRWQMPPAKSHLLPPGPAIDAWLSIFGSRLEVLHKAWQVIARKSA